MHRQNGSNNRHGHGSGSARPPDERSPAASVPSPPDVVMQEASGRANDPGRTVANVVHGEAPPHSAATARPSVAVMNSRGQPSRVMSSSNDSQKVEESESDSDDDFIGDLFRPPTPPNRPSRVLTTICLDVSDQFDYDAEKRFLKTAYRDKTMTAVTFNRRYSAFLEKWHGVAPKQRNAAPGPVAVERATSEAILPVVTDTGLPNSSSVMDSGTAGGTVASSAARSEGGIETNAPRPWLELTSTPKRKPNVVKDSPKSDIKRPRQEEAQSKSAESDRTSSTNPATYKNASSVNGAAYQLPEDVIPSPPQRPAPRPVEDAPAAIQASTPPAKPSSESMRRSEDATEATDGYMPSGSSNDTTDDFTKYNLQLQRDDRQALDSRMAIQRHNLPPLPSSASATSNRPVRPFRRVPGSPGEPTIYNLRQHMERILAGALQSDPRDKADKEANASSSSDHSAGDDTIYNLHDYMQNLLLPRSQRQPIRRTSPVLPPPALASFYDAPIRLPQRSISPSEPTLYDVERSAQMDSIMTTKKVPRSGYPLRLFPKPMDEVAEVTEPINPTPECSLESEGLTIEDAEVTQEGVPQAAEPTSSSDKLEKIPEKAKSPEKQKEMDSKASNESIDASSQPPSASISETTAATSGQSEEESNAAELLKSNENVQEKVESSTELDTQDDLEKGEDADSNGAGFNEEGQLNPSQSESRRSEQEDHSAQTTTSTVNRLQNAESAPQVDPARIESSISSDKQENKEPEKPKSPESSSDKHANEKKEKSMSPEKEEKEEDSKASTESNDVSLQPTSESNQGTAESDSGLVDQEQEAAEHLKNGEDVLEKAESVTESSSQDDQIKKAEDASSKSTGINEEVQSTPSQSDSRSEQQVQTATSCISTDTEVEVPPNQNNGQLKDQTPAESVNIPVPSRLAQSLHAHKDRFNKQPNQTGDTDDRNEVVERPSPVLPSNLSQSMPQVEARAVSPSASIQDAFQARDDSNNDSIDVEMEKEAAPLNATVNEAGSIDAATNTSPVQPTNLVPTSELPSQQPTCSTEGIRRIMRENIARAKELKKTQESEQPTATAVPTTVPTRVAAPAPAPPKQLRTAIRLAELLALTTPEDQNIHQNRDLNTDNTSDQDVNMDADSANNASTYPEFRPEVFINTMRSRLEGARQVQPTTGRPNPPVLTAPSAAPTIPTVPIGNEVVHQPAADDRAASPTLQNIVGVIGYDSNHSENVSASDASQDHDESMPSQPSQSSAPQPSNSPSLTGTIEAIKKLIRQSLEQPAGSDATIDQSLNAKIEAELQKYMKAVPHKCSTCGQNCNGCPIQPANGAVEPADDFFNVREPSETSFMETDGQVQPENGNGLVDNEPIVPMNDNDFEPFQLNDFEGNMNIDEEPATPRSLPERPPTPRPPTPLSSRSPSPARQLPSRSPTPPSRSPSPDGHLCGRHCRCPIMFEPPKNRRPARPAPYRRRNPRQNRPRLQPRDRAPRGRQTDPAFGRLHHIRRLAGANLPDAPPVVNAEQMNVVDGFHLDAANQVSVVRGEHYEAALYRSGVVVARGYFEGGSTASMSIRDARSQPITLFNQPNDRAISIAGGPNHLVILTRSGHLYTIGRAIEGQLGVVAHNLERYRQSSITPASMLRRVFDGRREALFQEIWVDGNVTVAIDRRDRIEWRCGEEHGPVFRKMDLQ